MEPKLSDRKELPWWCYVLMLPPSLVFVAIVIGWVVVRTIQD